MVVLADMAPVRRRQPDEFDENDRERADVAARHARMGRTIRIRREELGLSQKQLGDRLGIRQPRVSTIEAGGLWASGKGNQSRPVGWNIHFVHKIEKALDMHKGTLFNAGGYVPTLDLDSAVRTSPDLLESDKALVRSRALLIWGQAATGSGHGWQFGTSPTGSPRVTRLVGARRTVPTCRSTRRRR